MPGQRSQSPAVNDNLQLTIEKLVYGGDGLAHGTADAEGPGKAVFLPFVLPGERVEARITEEKRSFVRAWPETILQPSPERITPQCPYFRQCGGCHLQHVRYEYQLQAKSTILSETLQRIGGFEPPAIQVHSAQPWHYRNRTQMKVRGGTDFALGYFRFGSHQLLPVEQCPISSPLINRTVGVVWELGRARLVNQAVVELEFFVNAQDSQLLLGITLADRYWTLPRKPSLPKFITALRERLPEICGAAILSSGSGHTTARETIPQTMRSLLGAEELVYETAGYQYHVSAGSFFQTNRYLTNTLVDIAVAGGSGHTALDLYAGAGLFTAPLAQRFHEVIAVEAGSSPFHDLKRNAPSNVQASCETTEAFLRGPGTRRKTSFDLVIVDPPRAGLGEKTIAHLGRLSPPRLTYVSCNPATLARDLKRLRAAGFRVEKMDLVDLFPQTFHLETVTHLLR